MYPIFRKGNIYAEEPLPNLHAILHQECKWRDSIRERGSFATGSYEKQLSLRFPLLAGPLAKRPKQIFLPAEEAM